ALGYDLRDVDHRTSVESDAEFSLRSAGCFMIGAMAGRHRRESREAVVGGSIGGLTAALLLRDSGWDVDVFERSATVLEGRGGGIVLHPATIRYLVERTGVTPAELGVAVGWVRYLDRSGGIAHKAGSRY